ncbi:MAG: hypothetical protein COB26_10090 [Piscirickettsiaceae bacterium]|nr:MAG: hypothetical protein COB26_10090 [Piscirickettsiaceae bacterium]
MPSLTTAMKYHSKSATPDNVTGDMYFSDANSENIVIANDPIIMDTVILFNPDEKETWFFLPGVIGVIIMQVAGWVLFDLPSPTAHALLFVLAPIYVAVMISLGLLISLISKTQQQTMFIAIFIIVPSMLLSGFIFPLDAIPNSIKPLSYAILFTYFVEIIRGLLIKQTLFSDVQHAFAVLSTCIIIFVIASILNLKKL